MKNTKDNTSNKMGYIYNVFESELIWSDVSEKTYGIALCVNEGDITMILKVVPNISSSSKGLSRFVKLCNRLSLSPIHFYDAVEDYIATM